MQPETTTETEPTEPITETITEDIESVDNLEAIINNQVLENQEHLMTNQHLDQLIDLNMMMLNRFEALYITFAFGLVLYLFSLFIIRRRKD